MSGYLGDLSQKQEDKLNKFKEKLKDVLGQKHDDHLLLRFLRARSFDVHKSETFFRKDLEWRARLGVEKINNTFKLPEVCQKYWPGGIAGYDKDGGPVWIEPTGNVDPKGLLQSCKSSDLIKYNICRFEGFNKAIDEQRKKLGKPVAGFTYIMDMHGLGRHHLWKPGIDLYNQINTILQNHYPESLKVILLIRAPKIFPLAYALCRPYLDPDTRRKIHILGSDWREVLLRYVSEDVLPVHWGGKATDPDGNPMCPSKICLGGEVPKSYYFQDVNVPEEDMTVRDIKRGSILEFKYKVTKPGSFFRYAFKTKDHDIAFGIKRIDSNGHKVKVLEKTRVNSHFVLQDGQVELETTGYYIFKFDNSFSWTKSKRISYILELLEPIDDLKEEQVSTTNFNDNSVVGNTQDVRNGNIEDNHNEKKSSENNEEVDRSVKEEVKDGASVDKEEGVDEGEKAGAIMEKEGVTEGVRDGESMNKEGSVNKEVIDVTTEESVKGKVKGEDSENKEEIDGMTNVKEEPKNGVSENKEGSDEQEVTDGTTEQSVKDEVKGEDSENKEEVNGMTSVNKEPKNGVSENKDGSDEQEVTDKSKAGQDESVKEVIDGESVDKDESVTEVADVGNEDQKQDAKEEVNDGASEEKEEAIKGEVKDGSENKKESIKEESKDGTSGDGLEGSIKEEGKYEGSESSIKEEMADGETEKEDSAMEEVKDESIEDKDESVKEEERD